jgi:hypothetical protein
MMCDCAGLRAPDLIPVAHARAENLISPGPFPVLAVRTRPDPPKHRNNGHLASHSLWRYQSFIDRNPHTAGVSFPQTVSLLPAHTGRLWPH